MKASGPAVALTTPPVDRAAVARSLPMPRLRKFVMLSCLAGIGCAALVRGQGPAAPVANAVAEIETAHMAHTGYRIIPPVERALTAQQRLERNLEAFAAAVEAYEARAPRHAAPVDFDSESLDEEIGAIVDDIDRQAQVSVHVRELASDAVLFDYFGDTPLNPASNQKLVTASAALDLLGEDYTYLTRVYVRDDVLYVEGSGDPSIDPEALTQIGNEVAGRVGVPALSRIVVDDHMFTDRRFGPGYKEDGVGEAYQAPSGALSLAFNTVQVTVYPVVGSSRAGAVVYPPNGHVIIENKVRVGGSRSRVSVRSSQRGDHTVIELSGRMAKHAPPLVERRRVYDPALYTGATLATILAESSGTEPLPVARGRVPVDAHPIHVHESPPLIEIVDGGLAWSNNFIAEQLLRTLGWQMSGEPGDWNNGTQVLAGYWDAVGNDPDALTLVNGSGFSGEGRTTTSALVDLISMSHRVQGDAGLIAALPLAGEEGTMRARLRQSGKRVRAKTGTLDGVSGLSGVITAEDGTGQVAFSILINVRDGAMAASRRRDVEDRIVMSVLRHVDDFESRRGFLSFEPMWVYAGTAETSVVN